MRREWAGGDAFLCSALCDVATEPLPPLPPASVLGLKPPAAAAVVAFRAMLARWMIFAQTATVAEMLERVIEDIDYKAHLLGKKADNSDGNKLWRNVQQLLALANEPPLDGAAEDAAAAGAPPLLPRGLDALRSFLADTALHSATDSSANADDADAVRLMSMHSAKGLEFDAVFGIGLEDGIVPSERSLNEALTPAHAAAALEEERRLFYVMVTRAKTRLYLCRAEQRQLYPTAPLCTRKPSPFLAKVEAALGDDETMAVKRRVERPHMNHSAVWDVHGDASHDFSDDDAAAF
jgi:DNA helicase-2/ATP-dependent DNA helicase PcrA